MKLEAQFLFGLSLTRSFAVGRPVVLYISPDADEQAKAHAHATLANGII